MQLEDIISNAVDQNKGRPCDIVNPWTGESTGMSLIIAGPDSDIQRRARIEMMDELAERSNPDGTISAENREKARINCLAKCVLGWNLTEDDKAVPFSHKNVVRFLRAANWPQAQVDAFAGDRAQFKSET